MVAVKVLAYLIFILSMTSNSYFYMYAQIACAIGDAGLLL